MRRGTSRAPANHRREPHTNESPGCTEHDPQRAHRLFFLNPALRKRRASCRRGESSIGDARKSWASLTLRGCRQELLVTAGKIVGTRRAALAFRGCKSQTRRGSRPQGQEGRFLAGRDFERAKRRADAGSTPGHLRASRSRPQCACCGFACARPRSASGRGFAARDHPARARGASLIEIQLCAGIPENAAFHHRELRK